MTAPMRLRRYLFLLTLLAIPCVATSASAQDHGGGADLGGTNGIRLGQTWVLHLGIGIETGWDSNLFYEADTATTHPSNAFYLRLTPGFNLTTRPRQGQAPFQFDFHGGLGYVEYLTTNAAIQSHRQFNVDAGILAAFFQNSPYNFVLFDNYVRTTVPPYSAGTTNFDRDTNQLGTRVNLSPGGGRLTFNVGYVFGIDYFENARLSDFDLQYHRFDLRASWRFFPKTALYLAADETINVYPHPGSGAHPDSYPLHVMLGMQGLITPKLTVNAWIGYGNGFYQWSAAIMVPHENPNTAIGGLSLTWKPTMLSTGTVGYQHDFQNSLLGAYYDEDMAYISWTQLVWRFTGFIRAQYTNMRFKGVQPQQATTDGTDNNFMLNVRVDFPFKDWLIGSVGYDFYLNRSDRMIINGGAATPATVPVDYTKHVVYLRLSFQY